MEVRCLNCDKKYILRNDKITSDDLLQIKYRHFCDRNCKEKLCNKIKKRNFIQSITDLNYKLFIMDKEII